MKYKKNKKIITYGDGDDFVNVAGIIVQHNTINVSAAEFIAL
ncbi:Uncharacterised protein [Salmonella enterica subsp. enterica serovar Typhi]|uniref:Uncharacterized protein n=2 Tax=Salmonella enterica I TaxID=59201 RepID=M7RQL2_SALDU|nr:hypothetical protein I137_10955 [Salmonella enterica subsp. enterica serovar Pullorum str. S06004]AHU95007.1 hypothetical protein AU17_02720 [Salmonella enterica subsp. enterica serovar Enteritidis str. EC20110354]EMR54057.1 hypothetical protein A670_00693 [Salmonella enterica subsp. enterica serovar Dublin str. UC16]EPI62836.1 hypothetical protein A673_04997 [Salmonella enterica subsp. enterica serovar Enteritidis str. 2009K0958]EPI63773.1 hypothetical protein A672_04582 [Salmonella enteric